MKNIQWFPGHMAKAMRMMKENLSLTDGVIVVLDARCPASSFNPKLKELAGGKPVLYVLNKGDIADERADILLGLIKDKGAAAIKLNSVNVASKRDITGAINNLIAEKRERLIRKGFNKQFRIMVAGIPNTGKSTLINLLAGSARAETGNKAGVTRGKQWVRCDGFELLDTPGTMPPSFLNPTFAARLAYVGSVNDDILDFEEVSLALIKELLEKYPKRLEERYLVSGGTPLEVLEGVCARRGFMVKGGGYDYERGERAVIDDFRKCRLGRITLDCPADMLEISY